MTDYNTVAQTATRLGLSQRRVQALAKEGRFNGAMLLSGVWLIPADAKKPTPLINNKNSSASNQNQRSVFDFMKDETLLTLDDSCDFLGISTATGNNWIKTGRLVPSIFENKKPYFNIDDLRILLSQIALSDDKTLKSRRNKSQIAGSSVYSDYLTDTPASRDALAVVRQIVLVASHYPDSDEMIPYIVMEYSLRALSDSGRIKRPGNGTNHNISLLKAYLLDQFGEDFTPYKPLIESIAQSGLGTNQAVKASSVSLYGKSDCVPMTASVIEDTNSGLLNELLPLQLPYIPGQDVLGLLYISLKNLRDRKMTGTYYTPMDLVLHIVDAYESLQSDTPKRILDPCCGTGNFLLALISKGLTPDNFYGQDNDALSTSIARINMALNCESIYLDAIMDHIRCMDTLLDSPIHETYDLIIGNPPWGYSFDKETLRLIKLKYTTCDRNSAESFRLFMEYALQHISVDGMIAYVLPESMLMVRTHSSIRNLISKKCSIRYVAFCPDGFKNVTCPAIELIIQNSSFSQIIVDTPNEHYTIKTDRELATSPVWNLQIDDDTYELLSTMERLTPSMTLAKSADFALGIVTGNNASFLKDTPSPQFEPILRGSDIVPFGMEKPKAYIRFAPEEFQQCAAVNLYRGSEKLIYRFISSKPIFAYDETGILTLNSANIIVPNIPFLSTLYLLGLLNSKAACFYFQKKFHSVKLLRSHIEAFPIPRVDEEKQKPVIESVRELIRIQAELQACKVSTVTATATVAALHEAYTARYAILNDYIYTLYGFSNRQIQIVESQTECMLL